MSYSLIPWSVSEIFHSHYTAYPLLVEKACLSVCFHFFCLSTPWISSYPCYSLFVSPLQFNFLPPKLGMAFLFVLTAGNHHIRFLSHIFNFCSKSGYSCISCDYGSHPFAIFAQIHSHPVLLGITWLVIYLSLVYDICKCPCFC